MVQLDLICNILHSWDKRIALGLDKIFRNANVMRLPFSPGTWKNNVGRKRCRSDTCHKCGRQRRRKAREPCRGTRACRTVGRRCPWPWRNQPTTLYTLHYSTSVQDSNTPLFLSRSTHRQYRYSRPSSTPLPLTLPRFIDLQIHNVGSPSGYNAFKSVFVTKTNDKNNFPSGDYSKKLTVRILL